MSIQYKRNIRGVVCVTLFLVLKMIFGGITLKKKNKTANIIMVIIIFAIFAGGIFFVGKTKGLFGGIQDSHVKIKSPSGIVYVTRNGVSFALDGEMVLCDGDVVETKDKSEVVIVSGCDIITADENCRLKILSVSDKETVLTVERGDIYADVSGESPFFTVHAGNDDVIAENAVYHLSSQTGSYLVNVLGGEISVNGRTVKAANSVSSSETFFDVAELRADGLNDFAIHNLIESEKEVCFSSDELDKVLTERKNNGLITDGDAVVIGDISENETILCSVEINCSVILENKEKFTRGKEGYVPEDGMILDVTAFKIPEGITAFDLLRIICEEYDIQMEHSWTPVYDSSYVESINHIYEFDCGPMSGWKYKVNGWHPNYGSSQYIVKDGDVIQWEYSCGY